MRSRVLLLFKKAWNKANKLRARIIAKLFAKLFVSRVIFGLAVGAAVSNKIAPAALPQLAVDVLGRLFASRATLWFATISLEIARDQLVNHLDNSNLKRFTSYC